MQHGNGAHLRAEVTRIGGDLAQRIGGGAEQDGIDDALVLERDLRGLWRQGEDHVVVGHRQQLGLACFEPFGARQTLALRAVAITAGVVGATNEPTIGTVLDMPA